MWVAGVEADVSEGDPGLGMEKGMASSDTALRLQGSRSVTGEDAAAAVEAQDLVVAWLSDPPRSGLATW
ncbi:hypothetical protein GCM10018775_92160 [Streptomyces umbrinus]|nr:hypothetical protein GCM10018775_92160 [Streptomyces umbrinus]